MRTKKFIRDAKDRIIQKYGQNVIDGKVHINTDAQKNLYKNLEKAGVIPVQV
jgi:hypothetical protein